MLTRKTQYAWMALGGLICLCGLVLACKLRDGNKAIAQADKRDLPPSLEEKLSSPPPAMTNKPTLSVELLRVKSDKSKESDQKTKSSEPKATLDIPYPAYSSPFSIPASYTAVPAAAAAKPPAVSPSADTPLDKPPPLKPDVAQEKPLPPAEPLPSTVSPRIENVDILGGPSPATAKTALPEKTKETKLPPTWNDPAPEKSASAPSPAAEHETGKTQPGEPPLAPAPGPVQIYHVRGRETLQDIARRTLGSSERWGDLHKLNPTLMPEAPLRAGTTVRLPADACVQADDSDPVKPLPALRPKPAAPKAKVMPLTGTYQCNLDGKGRVTLPRALRDQLNGSDTVLLSPGPDKCLWLTNQPHLERLDERLQQAQVNESDVRVFKRLYFAQTEKLLVKSDGRVIIPVRLSEFAGLQQEVVLVGIDDHFEVWDAARWRSYTQQKSAGRTTTLAEPE